MSNVILHLVSYCCTIFTGDLTPIVLLLYTPDIQLPASHSLQQHCVKSSVEHDIYNSRGIDVAEQVTKYKN